MYKRRLETSLCARVYECMRLPANGFHRLIRLQKRVIGNRMFCLSSSPKLIQSETIENGETQEILTSEKLEPENVLVLLCDNDLNY